MLSPSAGALAILAQRKSTPRRRFCEYVPCEGVLPERMSANIAAQVSAMFGRSRRLPLLDPMCDDSSPWLQPPSSRWLLAIQSRPLMTVLLNSFGFTAGAIARPSAGAGCVAGASASTFIPITPMNETTAAVVMKGWKARMAGLLDGCGMSRATERGSIHSRRLSKRKVRIGLSCYSPFTFPVGPPSKPGQIAPKRTVPGPTVRRLRNRPVEPGNRCRSPDRKHVAVSIDTFDRVSLQPAAGLVRGHDRLVDQ